MRLMLLMLLLATLFCCQKKQFPIEKGVSQELARQRKAAVSNIRYDLNFAIPAQISERITGSETITFDLNSANSDLLLDFKGDTTAKYSITANGHQLETAIQNGHLVVDKSHLISGKNELKLSYTCPDWSLNRNPEFLYTLFVPDRASTAFPCFDQPDLKAEFKLHLTVPAEWKAVANGPVEKEAVSGATKSLDFKLTKLLPTYLFAFSAGKFDTLSQTREGRTVVLYHREKADDLKNNADSVFSLVFRSIKWCENYTQIPYPFDKYDLVAIPSFQYSGMEHPGTILYRASSLFLDAQPTQQQLLKRANLIAHETAHIWFGDLVTMPWFDEVWLKEVYANFIADKVLTPMFPAFNFDLQFLLAHYDAAYSVDRTSGANPIGQQLANMKDAGSLYGAIIYHKAPIVMRMLEQKTGEKELQRGLQQYLAQNKYGNAGWKDLISILSKGENKGLIQWSDIWVNQAERPHLKAKVTGKDLVIEQFDPSGKNRVWPQELDLIYPENGQLAHSKIDLNSTKTELKNQFSTTPDWVYLNAKGKTYGFVELDSLSANYFLNHFSLLKDDLLRASILTDLAENLYEKRIEPQAFVKMLVNELPQEANSMIFERMLSILEYDFVYKLTPDEQLSFQEKIEATLWSEYTQRKAQQTALINSIMRISASNETLAKLEDCLNYPKNHKDIKMSADQQTEMAYQLALKQPAKAIKILDKQENRIANPDKKAQFRFVRQSLNPSKADRDKFFTSLLQEENREHEPWVEQAMAFLNHPIRQNEALEYIRPALDKLQEIQRTGDIFFPKNWLDALLKGHSSKKAADVVKQFLNEHPDYPESLKLKILQSADHLLKQN